MSVQYSKNILMPLTLYSLSAQFRIMKQQFPILSPPSLFLSCIKKRNAENTIFSSIPCMD